MTTRPVPMITLRMLRGACAKQRRLFRSEWPKGAEATLENVLRAQELGLDLQWGAEHLFTPEARAEYARQEAPLWAECQRQRAALWAEYERQRAAIWAECGRQEAPLWAEYQRQRDATWAEYKRQEATIWAEYERQIAPIWLAAFLASQEGTA